MLELFSYVTSHEASLKESNCWIERTQMAAIFLWPLSGHTCWQSIAQLGSSLKFLKHISDDRYKTLYFHCVLKNQQVKCGGSEGRYVFDIPSITARWQPMLEFHLYLKFDWVIYDVIGRTWIDSEISAHVIYLGARVKPTKPNQASLHKVISRQMCVPSSLAAGLAWRGSHTLLLY